MRTVVHLSDLHFGRIDEALLEPLARRVRSLQPDVVVVSGDLTQRARAAQFRAARRFLDGLPSPQIVVPGNHDVPLYNLFLRFARPLGRFRRLAAADVEPTYVDEEIAVLGVNTARALAFKGGRINAAQIERLREKFSALDPEVVRIVVTHHPFDLPVAAGARAIVGRAARAMSTLAQCRADLLLAGHLHVAHAGDTAARYRIAGYSALVVQAGTATSTRERGELNSFNSLYITPHSVRIERYVWKPHLRDFGLEHTEAFDRKDGGWRSRSCFA